MSWRKLVTSFPIRDFLKPWVVGRPLLKVLMVTSSKLPSISLYISQYLSKYVFRVSPSRINQDSKECKGRGTPVCDKMKSQMPEWAHKGIYRIYPQAVEPSHHHGSQTGWEHLAHQGFVLRIDSHSLTEMAHILHRVHSPIVDGKCWLIETPRKSCPFNPIRERWLGNLVQGFAHRIISQPSLSWALAFAFTVVLLFIWEGFTRRSLWSTSITVILFIVGKGIRWGGSSFSLCMA